MQFSIPFVPGVSLYRLKIRYDGTDSIGGCTVNGVLVVGTMENLLLTGDKEIIRVDEDTRVTSFFTGSDVNGDPMGIPYSSVNIYDVIDYEQEVTSLGVAVDTPVVALLGADSTSVVSVSVLDQHHKGVAGQTVTFKSPSYTIGWGVNPKVVENDSIVDVSLKVSNKNLVDYQPTLTVTTPAGFSLVEAPVGDGVWSQVGTRVYTWKPRFSSSKGSISLGLRFDVSLGGSLPVSVGFDAVEGLTGASGSLSVSVVAPSEDSGSSDVPGGSDEHI